MLKPEVAKTATNPSPAPLQKHLLGGFTVDMLPWTVISRWRDISFLFISPRDTRWKYMGDICRSGGRKQLTSLDACSAAPGRRQSC